VKLTIVGCSGSFAGPESPASCYLVQAHDGQREWSLVLDLGNGALGALQRHLDPAAADALLLSHLHPDHCIDLAGLYVFRTYHPRGPAAPPLPVHGPAPTRDGMLATFEGLDRATLERQFTFHRLRDEKQLEIGPFAVSARRVNHPVEAYGFRVEAGGRVLAYTGDTDACDAIVALARDADLLLADSAFVEGRDDTPGIHLSGRRAAEAAVAAGARRLMLTHIPAWNDPDVCRADAATIWPGEVELARPDAAYDI